MKKYVLDATKRGLLFCVGGPIVLAIVYGILDAVGVAVTLTGAEACKGILTVTLMAFVAAGITVVYSVEQLPLPCAIGLHAAVLYADYLLIYLLNGWLKNQLLPISIFTGVFVVGFALIWLCVYLSTKAKTEQINKNLR